MPNTATVAHSIRLDEVNPDALFVEEINQRLKDEMANLRYGSGTGANTNWDSTASDEVFQRETC